MHPTRGGLRIGKPLPERGAGAPMLEREEWERDGQYFHYLTKWMHALARMGDATRDPHYVDQAAELALVAHDAFVYTRAEDGARLMHWKMSIDLGRPLVPSMSPHDPIDGLLTTMELRAGVATSRSPADASRLHDVCEDFASMEAATDGTTADPLGTGGMLAGAHALMQLMSRGSARDTGLLQRLLAYGTTGVDGFLRGGSLALPRRYRLAFRELGLAIGLRAVERATALWRREPARLGGDRIGQRLEALSRHAALGAAIEQAWTDPRNQQEPSWTSHADINEEMLATSLLPDGNLTV